MVPKDEIARRDVLAPASAGLAHAPWDRMSRTTPGETASAGYARAATWPRKLLRPT